MLLNKYLPHYHFSEKHSITISSSSENVFKLLHELDMSGSPVIQFLFKLRGLPSRMLNKEGMNRTRFIGLEEEIPREIIIGLIGQFWKPNGNLQEFKPDEFTGYHKNDFLKAVWNFEIVSQTGSTLILQTETRIQCLSEFSKKRFSRYWFFIRPFSGIIRKEILRGIKRKAERI